MNLHPFLSTTPKRNSRAIMYLTRRSMIQKDYDDSFGNPRCKFTDKCSKHKFSRFEN